MILSPAPNTAGGNSRFNFQTAKDDSGGEPSLRAERAIHQAAEKEWIASSLRSSQKPSYSAKAEYPVRRGFSTPSLAPWNTGSPAGACHRAAIRPTRWRAMTAVSVRVGAFNFQRAEDRVQTRIRDPATQCARAVA